MKKKKLNLQELKVTSFVTNEIGPGNEAETIKGGAPVPKTTICTVTNPIFCDFATANCPRTWFPNC